MSLPTSRAQAIAEGASQYQTSHPCGRNHTSPRYTVSGNCIECAALVMKERYKHKGEEIRSYVKNWTKDNIESSRCYSYARRFAVTYGITLEQRNAMIEAQGNKCKICSDEMTVPHVDHCHETKIVRGILCPRCNMGLGYFKDDTTRLAAAINYLENSNAQS